MGPTITGFKRKPTENGIFFNAICPGKHTVPAKMFVSFWDTGFVTSHCGLLRVAWNQIAGGVGEALSRSPKLFECV